MHIQNVAWQNDDSRGAGHLPWRFLSSSEIAKLHFNIKLTILSVSDLKKQQGWISRLSERTGTAHSQWADHERGNKPLETSHGPIKYIKAVLI